MDEAALLSELAVSTVAEVPAGTSRARGLELRSVLGSLVTHLLLIAVSVAEAASGSESAVAILLELKANVVARSTAAKVLLVLLNVLLLALTMVVAALRTKLAVAAVSELVAGVITGSHL